VPCRYFSVWPSDCRACSASGTSRTGEVWTFLGFPTYGGGPFEQVGIQASVPLLVGFLVVCLLEVVVGVLLWTGTSYASSLSYALLAFELAFWIGFALPLGRRWGWPARHSCCWPDNPSRCGELSAVQTIRTCRRACAVSRSRWTSTPPSECKGTACGMRRLASYRPGDAR
jgi:hypothetical protein